MIAIDDFIKKLEAEFEEVKPGSVTPATSFRDLEGWSSMHALIIIALIDTEFGVTLTGDDLRTASTVDDLYRIVGNKVKS